MSKRAVATLNGLVEEFLLERGAVSVGVATLETLTGRPLAPTWSTAWRVPVRRSVSPFPSTVSVSEPILPRRTDSLTRRTT